MESNGKIHKMRYFIIKNKAFKTYVVNLLSEYGTVFNLSVEFLSLNGQSFPILQYRKLSFTTNQN